MEYFGSKKLGFKEEPKQTEQMIKLHNGENFDVWNNPGFKRRRWCEVTAYNQNSLFQSEVQIYQRIQYLGIKLLEERFLGCGHHRVQVGLQGFKLLSQKHAEKKNQSSCLGVFF